MSDHALYIGPSCLLVNTFTRVLATICCEQAMHSGNTKVVRTFRRCESAKLTSLQETLRAEQPQGFFYSAPSLSLLSYSLVSMTCSHRDVCILVLATKVYILYEQAMHSGNTQAYATPRLYESSDNQLNEL